MWPINNEGDDRLLITPHMVWKIREEKKKEGDEECT